MRSATETPILRLLRAWEAINAEAHEYAVDDSLDIDAADKLLDRLFYGRAEAIKNELMTLPCTCAADFAAKLIVDTIKGSSIQEWETGEIWTEARRLTGISR
ncbi:hypothetical protein [Hyphomicrobium sp.]|uniref:hypothetical protein n=1 Tax=Hyphomicrobium sp. TaxID=82 RepID=UPI001D6C8F2B|nr:hypothetical protein [Hyphomicrobium sp.]MBY0559315.1 hypothetical protein [Hyphomicrobium sp.]